MRRATVVTVGVADCRYWNVNPVASLPFTWMGTRAPSTALAGDAAAREGVEHSSTPAEAATTAQAALPTVTLLAPASAKKPVPVIVTKVPPAWLPARRDMESMRAVYTTAGAPTATSARPGATREPSTADTTTPMAAAPAAPWPTVQLMRLGVAAVTVHVALPMVTRLEAAVAPKPVPRRVMASPSVTETVPAPVYDADITSSTTGVVALAYLKAHRWVLVPSAELSPSPYGLGVMSGGHAACMPLTVTTTFGRV